MLLSAVAMILQYPDITSYSFVLNWLSFLCSVVFEIHFLGGQHLCFSYTLLLSPILVCGCR